MADIRGGIDGAEAAACLGRRATLLCMPVTPTLARLRGRARRCAGRGGNNCRIGLAVRNQAGAIRKRQAREPEAVGAQGACLETLLAFEAAPPTCPINLTAPPQPPPTDSHLHHDHRACSRQSDRTARYPRPRHRVLREDPGLDAEARPPSAGRPPSMVSLHGINGWASSQPLIRASIRSSKALVLLGLMFQNWRP